MTLDNSPALSREYSNAPGLSLSSDSILKEVVDFVLDQAIEKSKTPYMDPWNREAYISLDQCLMVAVMLTFYHLIRHRKFNPDVWKLEYSRYCWVQGYVSMELRLAISAASLTDTVYEITRQLRERAE